MIRTGLIQEVIGMAIIDEHFRNALLADIRVAVLGIDLSDAELRLLVQAKADTFEQFSAKLDKLLLENSQEIFCQGHSKPIAFGSYFLRGLPQGSGGAIDFQPAEFAPGVTRLTARG